MNLFRHFKNLFSRPPKIKCHAGLKGAALADVIFQNLVIEKKVPGIAVTILKSGNPILKKGYGYADLETKPLIDPDTTVFRTASVSKCITGLAFGKMVEEGLLNWDNSLYTHVPYYPKKKYDFTLRQLASHTAGIRAYRGKEFALNKPYTIKESLEVFQNDPLVFKPGEGYLYTSFDFVLLSLAMEEASGVPFEDYVYEKVLSPLGMTNTFVPHRTNKIVSSSARLPDLQEVKNQAKFYTKTATGFKKSVSVNNNYKLAGGGYLSTSADIAILGQAILDKKMLRLHTYNELLTAQRVKGKSTFYGLGFQVSQDAKGRSFVGHVGSNVGGYSNLFVYPKEELVVSILVNCTDPKVQTVLDEAIKFIIEGATPPVA